MIEFSIRLVLCANGCPVGPRLERGTPLPKHELTYEDSPEGRERAEHDLEKIRKYIESHETRRK